MHPLYRPYIEASPFAVLATVGEQGLDTSPRGDGPGFGRPEDPALPDRPRRQPRNIARDPRVALLFLVPGLGETLRVNGTGISALPALCEGFAVNGWRRPRCW